MAKGSHQTYGGWEPRYCCVCGGRVKVSEGFWMRGLSNGGQPIARHLTCNPQNEEKAQR